MAIEGQSFPTPWDELGYRHELTQNDRASYYILGRLTNEGTETVIGYAGQWLIAGEAHISIIAVDPEWRHRGLGELLLLQMLVDAVAKGAVVAHLEVRRSNDAARALYRKYDFAEVGERPGYYKDTGDDAILMTADLSGPDYRQQLHRWQSHLWARLQAL